MASLLGRPHLLSFLASLLLLFSVMLGPWHIASIAFFDIATVLFFIAIRVNRSYCAMACFALSSIVADAHKNVFVGVTLLSFIFAIDILRAYLALVNGVGYFALYRVRCFLIFLATFQLSLIVLARLLCRVDVAVSELAFSMVFGGMIYFFILYKAGRDGLRIFIINN